MKTRLLVLITMALACAGCSQSEEFSPVLDIEGGQVQGVAADLDSPVAEHRRELHEYLLHDVFFLALVVFVIAHIYLGAGIFQPYKGSLSTMWGDGKISESDALYHWGKWAREEIEAGKIVDAPKK